MKYPNGKPQLKKCEHMMIGAYWSPIPTAKAYKNISECGITHMFVNTMIGHEKDDEGYYLKPFSLARNNGFKIIMHCMCKGYDNIKEYTEIFLKQDNFEGVIAEDEPGASEYEFLAKDYQKFKKIFPNKKYFVNLFPNYSNSEQMGVPTYEEYIEKYRKIVLEKYEDGNRVLMCDCYPLKIEKKIYPRWLQNIELLRKTANETNADLYLFLQSQGFLTAWRQPTTVAELTYQMYVYLAYGVRGLAHYPYRMPMDSPAQEKSCVTYHNRKTYMFDLVKQMNKELSEIDSVYMGFNHKATVKSNGKSNKGEVNENFENCVDLKDKYGLLTKVESDYDSIVGCFENAEGYQGYMAVNFSEPLFNLDNKITLSFDNMTDAIVIKGEKKENVKLKEGKLQIILGAGKGAFIVPYKI